VSGSQGHQPRSQEANVPADPLPALSVPADSRVLFQNRQGQGREHRRQEGAVQDTILALHNTRPPPRILKERTSPSPGWPGNTIPHRSKPCRRPAADNNNNKNNIKMSPDVRGGVQAAVRVISRRRDEKCCFACCARLFLFVMSRLVIA
jgi:hypothetical protein